MAEFQLDVPELLSSADDKSMRILYLSILVAERVDFNDRASCNTQPSIGCVMEIIQELTGEVSELLHQVRSALKIDLEETPHG